MLYTLYAMREMIVFIVNIAYNRTKESGKVVLDSTNSQAEKGAWS